MGKFVNSGRNLVASDLINIQSHVWWVVLGKCKFSGGVDHQWAPPLETPIPDEDVNDLNPDLDMDVINPGDSEKVGIRRASEVLLVVPDTGGPIIVNGVNYSPTTDILHSHVYWKFEIAPEDFIGDVPNADIEGYRRISVRADVVPDSSHLNATAMRKSDTDSFGQLFFYSNEALRLRPVVAPLNERQTIKIVLQPSMII